MLKIFFIIFFAILIMASIVGFFKVATGDTYIESDTKIIRYILTGCEGSEACSRFLRENGFPVPLTKKYLKSLKRSNLAKFLFLIDELNYLINREAYLKSKNSENSNSDSESLLS